MCSFSRTADPRTLRPNPANPNRHSADQVERLAGLIEAHGWRSPIVVSKRSGLITRGHGRLLAALKLECNAVPVDDQDYASEAEERADMLADNIVADLAEMDRAVLKDNLVFLREQEYDLRLTAMDPDVLQVVMIAPDIPVVPGGSVDHAKEWAGMPEYRQEDLRAYAQVLVNFATREDLERFARALGQEVTGKERSIWYPPQPVRESMNGEVFVDGTKGK
jgi:hypothetical protein